MISNNTAGNLCQFEDSIFDFLISTFPVRLLDIALIHFFSEPVVDEDNWINIISGAHVLGQPSTRISTRRCFIWWIGIRIRCFAFATKTLCMDIVQAQLRNSFTPNAAE